MYQGVPAPSHREHDRPARAGGGRSRDRSALDPPPAQPVQPAHAVPDLDVPYAVGDLPPARRRAAGDRPALRGQGQPRPKLLAALAAAGCRFDVASPAEITAALLAGAPADARLLQPGQAARGRAVRGRLGVELFVVDSPARWRRSPEAAPGAGVLCRLVTSGAGSDWPLSRKYGCSTSEAVAILPHAARSGCAPTGVLPRRLPAARPRGLGRADRVGRHRLRRAARGRAGPVAAGPRRRLPCCRRGCPPPEEYGAAIERHLAAAFGDQRPTTIAEPGRGIAADAGVLVATVVGVVHRAGTRWVFLDAGVFTGLVETLDEAIRYPLSHRRVRADGSVRALAGPTCDSADVLYEQNMVELPLALAEGDRVRFHCAGAYTATYSTVGFNGFAPLPTVVPGR